MTDDPVGQAIQTAFSALDDLIILANQGATRDQVLEERVMLGQLLNRCQLLASFALTFETEPRWRSMTFVNVGVR